jgi:hypothetical protein
MSNPEPSESLSFPSFSLLPTELRLEVWRLAFPPARLIGLHTVRGELIFTNSTSNITRRRKHFKHLYASKVQVPTVLHVCQESRSIASRHYQLTFDSNPRPPKALLEYKSRGDEPSFPFETAAMIYCDLDRDIVFLTKERSKMKFSEMPTSSYGFFENFVFTVTIPKDILCRIKYLALSNMLWNGSARFAEMRDHLRSLDALKGLIILEGLRYQESKEDWENRVEKIKLKFPEGMRPRVKVVESEQVLRQGVLLEG